MQDIVTTQFKNSPNTSTLLFTYGYSTYISAFNVLVRLNPLVRGN